MNQASNEGISLLKMAVTVLLAVLVISALAFIFYRVLGWVNKDTQSVRNQLNEVQMDKFFELEDMSNQARGYSDPAGAALGIPGTGNYPLVTVVANTILECPSQDILFYQVFDASTGASLGAFSSADLTDISITGSKQTVNPEDTAAAFLMQYSGKRCIVTVMGDGDDGQEFPTGMYAILISVIQ